MSAACFNGHLRTETMVLVAQRQTMSETSNAAPLLTSSQRRSSRCSRNVLTGTPPSSSKSSGRGSSVGSALIEPGSDRDQALGVEADWAVDCVLGLGDGVLGAGGASSPARSISSV